MKKKKSEIRQVVDQVTGEVIQVENVGGMDQILISFPKHRTAGNYRFGDRVGDMEINEDKSVTIPGMAADLQQIINQWKQGRDFPVRPDIVFEGHLNLPDVRVMDKVEREEYKQLVYHQIADYRKRLAQYHKDKDIEQRESFRRQVVEFEKREREFIDRVEAEEKNKK